MRWSNRSGLYKFTLILFYFIFLVYMLAFSVPTWWGKSGNYQGLWLKCTGVSDDVDWENCTTLIWGDDGSTAWMDGVRGVWTAGGAFYLMAVLLAMGQCCCGSEKSKDYGVAGIWGLIAGLDGAAGVIVVAVKTSDNDELNKYRWGFYLACAASGCTIILSIMLFITRNLAKQPSDKARKSRTADYVYSNKHSNHHDYQNHGYKNDDIPLGNGVSHHHTPHQYSMYRGEHQTQPSAPYGSSLPRQGGGYPGGYQPYGYPNQRHSVAESADLSNGYTTELIHAEHSLSRSNRGDGGYGGRYYQANGRY